MIRKGIYDLCAPEYIEIENHGGYIIWKSCCVYNDWFTDDELPEFKFEIQQYKDALEQLKSLINDRWTAKKEGEKYMSSSIVTSEKLYEPTPSGGNYSEIFYLNDNNIMSPLIKA